MSYQCDVCKGLVLDNSIVYELYFKKARAYSDCMEQTIICGDQCLRTLADAPQNFIDFQEE